MSFGRFFREQESPETQFLVHLQLAGAGEDSDAALATGVDAVTIHDGDDNDLLAWENSDDFIPFMSETKKLTSAEWCAVFEDKIDALLMSDLSDADRDRVYDFLVNAIERIRRKPGR
jgi:hypothetical protein